MATAANTPGTSTTWTTGEIHCDFLAEFAQQILERELPMLLKIPTGSRSTLRFFFFFPLGGACLGRTSCPTATTTTTTTIGQDDPSAELVCAREANVGQFPPSPLHVVSGRRLSLPRRASIVLFARLTNLLESIKVSHCLPICLLVSHSISSWLLVLDSSHGHELIEEQPADLQVGRTC